MTKLKDEVEVLKKDLMSQIKSAEEAAERSRYLTMDNRDRHSPNRGVELVILKNTVFHGPYGNIYSSVIPHTYCMNS